MAGALNRSGAECGFKEGYLLSPYLFILCLELLSASFAQEECGLGVPITNRGNPISHLLYADNILCFVEAMLKATRTISGILANYCSWIEQRVNRRKSAVLRHDGGVSGFIKELNFHIVMELNYLGIKLATRKLITADFTDLLRRARAKVNAWGNRHLSLAGWATLINASLLPSTMYQLTHMIVPRNVLQAIEKMSCSFLWDKKSNIQSIHYIVWDKLCQPSSLGFHAAKMWKGPLRARLAWDVISRPNTMLSNYFSEKYGNQPWEREKRRGDSTTWAIIKDGFNSLMELMRWNIADGTGTKVLQQVWILDRALFEWPSFYKDDINLHMRVAELLTADKRWDVRKLEECFSSRLTDRIKGIAIHENLIRDSPELVRMPIKQTITSLAYGRHLVVRQ